jgi:hypothetical protein
VADSWEAIDRNSRGSLTAVSSVDGVTIIRLVADPVTGRLLVDSSGGGGGNTFVYNEVVSGSGTSWTLANAPIAGLQSIYANGQKLLPTTDYSISGANITTVDSWSAGQISADYQH